MPFFTFTEPQIKPRMPMGDTQSMNPRVMLNETCCQHEGVPEECMGLCRDGLHHHRRIMADFPANRCDQHLPKIHSCVHEGILGLFSKNLISI